MTRGRLVTAAMATAITVQVDPAIATAQGPAATFTSSVDLVRVSAVVRDRKGRFVRNLSARDFEVIESGESRAITGFRRDASGVSVALLFDVSGSMQPTLGDAREAAAHVLSWLEPARDEAAIFTFDTQLMEITPFTTGLKALPDSMAHVVPFGATSLHDAIGLTAQRVVGQVVGREERRRALVVLTDGNDTASRLSAGEVSAIASAIDVPVYIFGIVPAIDNPAADVSTTASRSPFAGPLSDLAAWTGGRVFVASSPAERSAAARQIIDELRHQYLIAFEASGKPGWHPLEVRAHGKDLVIRARSGYFAGQSRPNSD